MKLPVEVFNRIMLYNSHPTADIMRAIIHKANQVLCMRFKNPNCAILSFYKIWCNIELDQARIDQMMMSLKDLVIDADF